MELLNRKPFLTDEFEKFFKICEICDLLSYEINTRYFLNKSNMIGIKARQELRETLHIIAPLHQMETAYKIATRDYFKQSDKLIKLINANL